MGWMLPMRCEASQLQRLQKQELRTGGRGPIYTLSRIKNDSCGLCRLSKIAHTRDRQESGRFKGRIRLPKRRRT